MLRPVAALLVVASLSFGLPAVSGAGADAAAPWWQQVGFPGQAVSRVAVVGGRVVVMVGGRAMAAMGGGFVPAPPPPRETPTVTVGTTTWSIDPAGDVLVSRRGGPEARDPGSPGLGAGAHLIAAPLGLPSGVPPASVVVAVSSSGVVWRRASDGTWSVSLVLLPRTLLTGTPAVTSIAAFNASRQSSVVYLGTAGYGTLLSDDGGDDWTRASPGLPSDVLSLAADPAGSGAVWAGTGDGLYVHRLQPLPQIPSYPPASLVGKWLVTAGVCALAVLLAGGLMVGWSRRARGSVLGAVA